MRTLCLCRAIIRWLSHSRECPMTIAFEHVATAGQAINRDLFEESLETDRLPRFREPMGSAPADF